MPSAKRYGTDADDLEYELRIRRIEEALERKLDGNLDASATSRGAGSVPQVTGLRVVGKNPGTVTVAWNAVTISDLRRYDLRFAEDLAFTSNVQTLKVATTQYQLDTVSATGGAGNTTLYVKVRAVNVAGQTGLWSVILNTATGTVVDGDIADNAVTPDKVIDTNLASWTIVDLSSYLATQEGLKGSLVGLELSRPTDLAITISAGTTTQYDQWLTSDLTKTLTNWQVGDNKGGLASGIGTVTADTWYYVFLIRNSSSLAVDAGFDTSLTATNLLSTSSYNQYRLLGAVKTAAASASLLDFIQDGELFMWKDPSALPTYTTTPGVGTRTTYTLNEVPTGVRVEAIVHMGSTFDHATPQADGPSGIYVTDLQMTDTTPVVGDTTGVGNAMVTLGGNRVATQTSFTAGEAKVMTNTSQQIGISAVEGIGNQQSTEFTLRVHGYYWRGLRGPQVVDA